MNGNYGVDYFNKNQPLIKKQKLSYTIEGALEGKLTAWAGPLFISKWNSEHCYRLLYL